MSGFGQDLQTGQFGPPVRGGSGRRPGWQRIAISFGVTAAVILVGLAVTLVALVAYGDRARVRVDVEGTVAGGVEAGVERITDVRNLLIVGNDSRQGLTDEELLRLGTEDHGGMLTDTIMLLQLDPNREKAVLISFPRDLFVTRCDGSRGRINAAFSIGEQTGTGGPSCLVQTVTQFTGISVNHYVQVNFAGFVRVVDTLGGVTMHLDAPLTDRHAGLDLPAGCVTLDGIDALAFVRARRLDDDFGRIARQQRFIKEIMQEATDVGTLVNIPKLFSLVDAVGKAVETDRDLSLAEMRRIAFSLRGLGVHDLDARTVPAVSRRIGGASYVVAKEEEAEALFQAFREGRIFPGDLGTEAPTQVTIADVPSLVILNGVGVQGLAARAQTALEERGFTVSETDNAENFDFERTQIIYPADMLEEAELVAAVIPGAALVPGPDDTQFTIVLGSDFDLDNLTPVPTAAPTPPAAATPPPRQFEGAEPGGTC